jgi:hypothetical protein
VNILKFFVVVGIILLFGCASTQEAPENLDKYSKKVKAIFESYKITTQVQTHKAFAVAKLGHRDFAGFGYSYPTIEQAEQRALEECHQRARKFNKVLQCFIYHSE